MNKPLLWSLIACLLLIAATIGALGTGRLPIATGDILDFLLASAGLGDMAADRHDMLYNLLVEIRLPRILAAMLVGASLAVSGASFQAVFRNPLVSPDLLGVMSGSAFGATLAMIFSMSWLNVQILAFIMGLVAVATGVGIALLFGRLSVLMLILGGVISSGLFSALMSILKYLADPEDQLPSIIYWLMGSLARAELVQTLWLLVPTLVCIVVLCLLGRSLDILSQGDDEALALGVSVRPLRATVIVLATLISALTVSLAGMVGWVGLIIPHIARLLVGPAHHRLLPLSALLGALFLLLCDTTARSVSSVEIPIGILTELIGIPVFLLVLHRIRRGSFNLH